MSRIRTDRTADRATITLDHPSRGNALSIEGWADLAAAVRLADDDPAVRVIILRGAGSDFSTGVDLADTWERTGRVDPSRITTDAENALLHATTPTVAQVQGNCVGGGLMIAAACDFRVSTEGARFALTPARLGLIYPASSVRVVTRLAGPSVARRMLIAGDWLTAQEALHAGLVDYVAHETDLDTTTGSLVDRLRALSPISQASAKEFIDQPDDADDGLEATRRWEEIARADPDQSARVNGFLNRKRTESHRR